MSALPRVAGDRNLVQYQALEPKPKVLIVGDDPVVIDALAILLADDFEVTATSDANRLAELASEQQPDAVVADLRMPGLVGLQILDRVRGAGGAQPPPLLVFSSNHDPRQRLRALELGVFDSIPKPVNSASLVQRLHRAVQYGRERQERVG